jgi:hypothetical protein
MKGKGTEKLLDWRLDFCSVMQQSDSPYCSYTDHFPWRYDTQQNDIQPNDTQHSYIWPNDTQHNDIQHNNTQYNI